VREVRRIIF
jgi:hypothetical protein